MKKTFYLFLLGVLLSFSIGVLNHTARAETSVDFNVVSNVILGDNNLFIQAKSGFVFDGSNFTLKDRKTGNITTIGVWTYNKDVKGIGTNRLDISNLNISDTTYTLTIPMGALYSKDSNGTYIHNAEYVVSLPLTINNAITSVTLTEDTLTFYANPKYIFGDEFNLNIDDGITSIFHGINSINRNVTGLGTNKLVISNLGLTAEKTYTIRLSEGISHREDPVGFYIKTIYLQPTSSDNNTIPAVNNIFKDVANTHWAFDAIKGMMQTGVVAGYSNGEFRPKNNVTREEFAKMLVLSLNLPTKDVQTSSFVDLPITKWSSPYGEAAKNYLTGYESNGSYYYKPADYAQREDVAYAMVKAKGYENEVVDISELSSLFSDSNQISRGFEKYILIAYKKGLVSGSPGGTNGKNVFNPKGTITRAEAATLLYNSSDMNKGDIEGKIVDVAVTLDKITDVVVTLDKITVDDKEFGIAFDGTWFMQGLPDNSLNESKYIITDYTIKAKKDIDLKDVKFVIIYEGGYAGDGEVSPGTVTPEGADKFGFYQIGTSVTLKAGDTKKIKTFIKLNNGVLSADKIYLQVRVEYDGMNIEQNSGRYDITSYVK